MLDVSDHEVTQTDDCFNLGPIGSQVVRHTTDDLGRIELRVGDLVGHTEWFKYAVDALGFQRLVGCTRDFYRHPHEIALFYYVMVDQILRPTMANCHEITADIRFTTTSLIVGVHQDDRDASGMCLRDDLCQTTRIRHAGNDPSSVNGDRCADSLLLRRNIAAVKGGANVGAG